MLNKLKEILDQHNIFDYNQIYTPINLLTKTLNDQIPYKMKVLLCISELILFSSQFRRNIRIPNDSSIPINAITFCIGQSGIGKDSSISLLRRAFKEGYDLINKEREELNIARAIQEAEASKKANPRSPEVYSKYLKPLVPLHAAISTNEGFTDALNSIEEDNIGAGYIYSGEFASELENSNNILDNLKMLSELYDMGTKEVKIIKDKDRQSKKINSLPVSALFITSPDALLVDERIKSKFKIEFSSKLARRSFFNFNNQDIDPYQGFDDVHDLIRVLREKEEASKELLNEASSQSLDIAEYQLKRRNKHIKLDPKAIDLYETYKLYCQYKSNEMVKDSSLAQISRRHMYWKALKLAGAIAIYQKEELITEGIYAMAAKMCEYFSLDLPEFESYLNKETHELFSEYMFKLSNRTNDKVSISLHELKKLKFIKNPTDINNLLKLVTSNKDDKGIYTKTNEGIEYTILQETFSLGVSYVLCSGSKEQRVSKCSQGFQYKETTFEKLEEILKLDCAYSPFRFDHGKREEKNIVGKIKWIALDIDQSEYTDEQIHLMLNDYNHYIVRTSDKTNPYKFRLLLELDSEIELDSRTYKVFLLTLKEFLKLNIDILPRSQIMFSYKGRTILKQVNGLALSSKQFLLEAMTKLETKKTSNISNGISIKHKQTALDNPTATFDYAYDAPEGEGMLRMFRAVKHAKDLGADTEYIINLIEDINSFWESPMEYSRLENQLIKPLMDNKI